MLRGTHLVPQYTFVKKIMTINCSEDWPALRPVQCAVFVPASAVGLSNLQPFVYDAHFL